MSVKPLSKVGMIFVQKGKEKSYKLNKVKKNLKRQDKKGKNLDVKELFDELIYKIDNMNISSNSNGNLNVYGEPKNSGAIDVDIKRNFSNYKADKTKIVVVEVKSGKVNNKLDKLRALRKR